MSYIFFRQPLWRSEPHSNVKRKPAFSLDYLIWFECSYNFNTLLVSAFDDLLQFSVLSHSKLWFWTDGQTFYEVSSDSWSPFKLHQHQIHLMMKIIVSYSLRIKFVFKCGGDAGGVMEENNCWTFETQIQTINLIISPRTVNKWNAEGNRNSSRSNSFITDWVW